MEGDDSTNVNGGFTGGQKGVYNSNICGIYEDAHYDAWQVLQRASPKDPTHPTLFAVAVMLSYQVVTWSE